jgi:hypothetical protein
MTSLVQLDRERKERETKDIETKGERERWKLK